MEPVLRQIYDGLLTYVQQGYQMATPYVQNYTTIPPVVMTSGVVASFAGHAVTRLFGETVGITSSVALAYAGAEMMHAESTKALLLAAGIQMLPSIFKRVVSDVASSAIIGSGKLLLMTAITVCTLPCRGCESAKVKKLKEKVEALKSEKIKLSAKPDRVKELEEKVEKLKAKNSELSARIVVLEEAKKKTTKPKVDSEPSNE